MHVKAICFQLCQASTIFTKFQITWYVSNNLDHVQLQQNPAGNGLILHHVTMAITFLCEHFRDYTV